MKQLTTFASPNEAAHFDCHPTSSLTLTQIESWRTGRYTSDWERFGTGVPCVHTTAESEQKAVQLVHNQDQCNVWFKEVVWAVCHGHLACSSLRSSPPPDHGDRCDMVCQVGQMVCPCLSWLQSFVFNASNAVVLCSLCWHVSTWLWMWPFCFPAERTLNHWFLHKAGLSKRCKTAPLSWKPLPSSCSKTQLDGLDVNSI